MKKSLFIKPLAAFALVFLFLGLSNSYAQNYWQQKVQYRIQVRLDDSSHMLHGNEEVVYQNNSPETLQYIWFHLWPNAYKNDKSAFAKQQLLNKKDSLSRANPFARLNKNKQNNIFSILLEKNELISDIVFRKPDIVFVAMGSPKQELLMQEISNIHQALYQGLGGSFDVYIGNVLRAPKWWVNNNLEWAYRLFKQPKRIKRQIYLFKFLVKLALNRY